MPHVYCQCNHYTPLYEGVQPLTDAVMLYYSFVCGVYIKGKPLYDKR